MEWERWLDVWEMHARSDRHRRAFDKAVMRAQEGAKRGRMFIAMSGGKDSVALAAVLAEAGIAGLPMAHVHTELNTPGMLACAEECADVIGYEINIVEPDYREHGDVWTFLRAFDGDITDKENFKRLCMRIASGNLLVSYLYAGKFDGSFSGMRADESRGRTINRRVRGPTYKLLSDSTWMSCPIVDMSARDVFAIAVRHGLPICDHYRLLHERFGVDPESPASRVDCVLTDESIVARGSLAHVRSLYPDLWSRLRGARPELARYT